MPNVKLVVINNKNPITNVKISKILTKFIVDGTKICEKCIC